MPDPAAADTYAQPDPPASAPRKRWPANAFIVVFLAYQIAMPLGYYLSDRVSDERFGWRMFSTVRLQQCELSMADVAEEGGAPRPAVLTGDLHIAWINLLKRGWPPVIEKYLRTRCASEKLVETRLERRCRGTDGVELPAERFAMSCKSGELRPGEATP